MTARPHRPFLVGLIAILVGVQAVFALLFGFGIFIERNDGNLIAHVDQSSGELGTIGVIVMIVGAVELLVAIGLWRGNNLARLLAAIPLSLQVLGGLYLLIAYEGTVRWQGLWQALFATLILYLLFNRSAERFFSFGER